MLKLPVLDDPAPRFLLFVESLVAGYALGPLYSAFGEREHLVAAALRSLGGMLPDVPGANHTIHPPPRRVGVSLEVSFGQVTVSNTAIHPHVGYRSIRAVLKILTLRARIVLAPVAVALPLFSLLRVVAPGASLGPGPGIAG